MNQERNRRIHFSYGILLAVLVLVAGVCFAASSIVLYTSGSEQPFTPERVAEQFSRIAIAVWLCVAGVIGGGIVALVFPVDTGAVRARMSGEAMLRRLVLKLEHTHPARIFAEKHRRLFRYLRIFAGVLSACALIPFILHVCRSENFETGAETLNGSVIQALFLLLPALLVAFGLFLALGLIEDAQIGKDIRAVKAALQGAAAAKEAVANQDTGRKAWTKLIFRILALTAAVAFVVLGILNGGAANLLGNAIVLCTSCIGLG